MQRVLIDTDPGIDHTAALFFALASGAPGLFRSTRLPVLVENQGALTRGQTVPEVDAPRLTDQFTETLIRGGSS
jgi:inosine-uridine nucleoside N-ribohydrolase